ncbi:hypothetical protein I5Q34_08985 [Streptomyces sp. AV19]|uniref:hypothetical protein n=1 Tax=Streptomyces sp. AV19 TaxID=2793068 RepID=UPI0018FE9D51|nr:hypothetical protein [Streptomyces sp. AV19]MBH1934421.1 hypothetical protein [Streptomyces sp. AV19]MDG4533211.1 hypothetical protein [Streptomyces sp. AV19]
MSAPRTFFALTAAALALAATAVGSTPAVSLSEDGGPEPEFAQLSSGVDQVQDGTVKTVQFEQADAYHGVEVTKESVTVRRTGTYLIVVAPQVYTDNGGVQEGKDPTTGCVDTWFSINDQSLPNSGVRLCQAATHSTHVVVSQSATRLKKGDTVKVRAKGDGVRFNAVQPSEGPLIPSVILTLTRLS